ncbi:MAG: YafY family protein [Roseiflexaceae bacterium]|nr:YafY family protein [Roseiflexaceae bacterium]
MSSKLNRIVQMDMLIRAGGYPGVADFKERFEVSERTVYDDIEYFRSTLRAPLKYSRSRRGYYYSDPTWVLPAVMATEGELLAFFLSAELVRRYLGTAFEAPLRNAIEKLAANLPQRTRIDLSDLTQHYTFQPGATVSADPVLLTALSEAIVERWRVAITYYTASRGERNERVIEPYHLYNVRGDWQVIAFDHLRNQFRNFAVSNIERWEVRRDKRFVRDADFSPDDYLAQGFLAEHGGPPREIVVRFDEYQARYILRRTWHPTQSIEQHDDGGVTLRFRTGALNEVRRWVLGYGPHAIVLAPPDLRAAVIADLRAALAAYENDELPESSPEAC